MGVAPTAVEVFCCYAHEDEAWRQKLETHLSPLKRQGLISLWYDRLIVPGAVWAASIDMHLEAASVILLLVSPDFVASDYCYGVEMKQALERHAAGEARVVPILLRPVDLKGTPFAHLQALPTDAKPIVLWRNKDQALADVAAGLRRVIEDVPLLAASAPRAILPPIWNIPYPRNPFFLGREDELATVHDRLTGGQATTLSQPQVLSGIGGIGKSQLALEYAHRYHQDYQAVLWARAESTEALVSSFVAIASLLRLPEREAKKLEIIVQAVQKWLQTHRGWLLILDNADELAWLPKFLPSSPGGHLLLTTRAAVTGQLARPLEMAAFRPEHGALFLLRRAGVIAPDAPLSKASSQERELALRISQELGGLPLALDQAGAYLEETQTDLAGYWRLYQQRRADLLRRRGGGLVDDHPSPVATTWFVSFRRVEERNAAAADLLRLLAFLASDSIAEENLTENARFLGPVLAPIVADAWLFDQAIEALRAYSLVRRDPGKKSLSIHPLLQVVLRDTLSEAGRRTWAERALNAVNAAFPSTTSGSWVQHERVLPQALAVTELTKPYQLGSAAAAELRDKTTSYLEERGFFELHAELTGLVRNYVKRSGVVSWKGQEANIAEDIVQEALFRVFEYTSKTQMQGLASASPEKLNKVLTWNLLHNQRRRSLFNGEIDLAEALLEQQNETWLFSRIAKEIRLLPEKVRLAVLSDLAQRMETSGQRSEGPMPLRLALLKEGIHLEAYTHRLPKDPAGRARHTALANQGYQRLAKRVRGELDGKSEQSSEPVQPTLRMKGRERNALCPCGSGKKFKKCHG